MFHVLSCSVMSSVGFSNSVIANDDDEDEIILKAIHQSTTIVSLFVSRFEDFTKIIGDKVNNVNYWILPCSLHFNTDMNVPTSAYMTIILV